MARFTTTPAATLPRRRLLLAAAAGAAWLLHPLTTLAAAPSEAEQFIATLGERTVRVLDRPGSDQAGRARGMAEVLDQAVDVEVVARLVLGRHWRAASEAQRREYVALFRAYVLDTLGQRFSYYTGSERFEITGSRDAGGNDTLVNSRILYTGYPPTHIDWRVRRDGGRLMIVDIVAEGVSMLVTNRSEFDSIVSRGGVDGLLRELRTRSRAAVAAAPA
jgi:phospholipid transport system substrate-binding protein